jgi:hypothetical protein
MVDHSLGSGNETSSSGISMMDIAGLPEQQSWVMLFLLRQQGTADGVTMEMLQTHFETLDYLSEIIDELVKQGWVVREGEAPDMRYRVALRRRTRIRSNTMSDLLATLGD